MNKGTRAVLGVPVWEQESCNFEIDLVFREPMKQEKHDVYRSVRNCSFESDFVCTVLSTRFGGQKWKKSSFNSVCSFETNFACREPNEQKKRDVYQSGHRKAVVS